MKSNPERKEYLRNLRHEIASDPYYKKNPLIAKALAEDLESLTGIKAEAMVGKPHYSTTNTPGWFISTEVFKSDYEIFLLKKDAEMMRDMVSRSISMHRNQPRIISIKVVKEEFGILESFDILIRFNSPLTSTIEKMKVLSVSKSFGI